MAYEERIDRTAFRDAGGPSLADSFASHARFSMQESAGGVSAVGQSSTPLSQREIYETVSQSVIDAMSRTGLLDRHEEMVRVMSRMSSPPIGPESMLDALTKIKVDVEPPDLSKIEQAILLMQERHREVLSAISLMKVSVEPPDLSQIERDMSLLFHKETNSQMAIQKMMQQVTPEIKDDIKNMMRDHRTDFLQMKVEIGTDLKKSVDSLRKDLQDDMIVLQQEVLRNRQQMQGTPSSPDLQGLTADIKRHVDDVYKDIQEDIVGLRQEVLRSSQQCQTRQVLVEDVRGPPEETYDYSIDILRLSSKLDVELSKVMQAIREISVSVSIDEKHLGKVVADVLLQTKLSVDHTDILQALKGVRVDERALARVMMDNWRQHPPSVNNVEVLQAIRQLSAELPNHVRENSTARFDLSPIITELRSIDLSKSIKLDHSPVLGALRRIEVLHEADAIGRTVSDHIRRANIATSSEIVEVLQAVKGIKNSEALEAISAVRAAVKEIGSFDMNFMLKEISKVAAIQSDNSSVLRAIANLQLEIQELRESIALKAQHKSARSHRDVQKVAPRVMNMNMSPLDETRPCPAPAGSEDMSYFSPSQNWISTALSPAEKAIGLPAWWILWDVRPAGPKMARDGSSRVSFSKEQQRQFGIDERGEVMYQAKFDSAIAALGADSKSFC